MSMEIYVLSDKQLPSIADWQQAIDAELFDLRLSTERPFGTIAGHLPAWWGEKRAGFECDHWSVSDLLTTYKDINFGKEWRHALAFRWGADLNACQAANMAATAYARATDGVVFDPASARILTAHEAAGVVREMEKSLPAIEASLRDIVQRFTLKS